jgi:hypothetical protein
MFRFLTIAALAAVLFAQDPKPFEAQSSSSIKSAGGTIDIRNVTYEVATNIPGRAPAELLLLRKTIQSKEILGDIGLDATVTLDAWRFGDDVQQKPLYTLRVSGMEGHALDNAIFVVSRGLEEVEWWSIYKLGAGQHLFDTYVPLLSVSISRETVKTRYLGLEVPEDDTKDARLKQPNVIAVLTYASENRVLREALLTSDDRQQARLLRSFADVTRKLTSEDSPARSIKLSFRQNYPSPPNPVEVLIPIKGDDLDLANAKLPARMHVVGWKR